MTLVERARVRSSSDESITYVVTFVGDEAVSCTCPHFHYRAETSSFECKHMRNARNVKPLSKADLVRLQELLRRG